MSADGEMDLTSAAAAAAAIHESVDVESVNWS
jgi:hypothetical protein